MNTLIKVFVFVGMLALMGCVSKPVAEDPEHAPVLMITENSAGEVQLSWDSEPGYRYHLFYAEKGDTQWRPVNRTFIGTGERMSVKDRVNPRRPRRRYLIEADKLER